MSKKQKKQETFTREERKQQVYDLVSYLEPLGALKGADGQDLNNRLFDFIETGETFEGKITLNGRTHEIKMFNNKRRAASIPKDAIPRKERRLRERLMKRKTTMAKKHQETVNVGSASEGQAPNIKSTEIKKTYAERITRGSFWSAKKRKSETMKVANVLKGRGDMADNEFVSLIETLAHFNKEGTLMVREFKFKSGDTFRLNIIEVDGEPVLDVADCGTKQYLLSHQVVDMSAFQHLEKTLSAADKAAMRATNAAQEGLSKLEQLSSQKAKD